MKLHLLCKRYYTNKDLIQERFGRLYHLPTQIQRLGCDVKVTALDYRHPMAERHVLEEVIFKTLPATPLQLASSLRQIHGVFRSDSPDIVVASGDSHIGFLGLQLAHILGAPFVFDVYDYYPAFSGNCIPGMRMLFRKAVKGSALVLCASNPLMERLASLNSARLLIENGVDRQLFVPMDQMEARKNLSIGLGMPVIGYFGSIQPARGPLLIEACRLLRAVMPTLTLLLAGTVSRVPIAEPWIRYFGQLPQEAIPELIAACNLVTIPYADDEFNAMSSACKIAEYLSCRRPVVATDIAGHRQLFGAVPQSLCQPDPLDMANAIRRQLFQPQVAPFPENLKWEKIAHTLIDALTELTNTKSDNEY